MHRSVLEKRDTVERLCATLERAPVGIAHVDLQGRWQLVNRRLCEILGLRRDELLAESFQDYLGIDLQQGGQALRGGRQPFEVERRYARKDGELVWCRLTISAVRDADQSPKYYVAIVEDISARKAVDGALGAAAHELRLPLSHIKGFISSLRRTDTKWDARTQREFLAEAEREANRLEYVIEDLLEHSADGRGARRRVRISPSRLVIGGLARVGAELRDRQVRVDVPSSLPSLEVDVPAIERVLVNLLDNATKYSPGQTPIDVSGRLIGDMLELSVDDRGPGVPSEESDRIFEPFYRRDVRMQGGQAGRGLGLAICRSIVTAHGGHIWVAPRPGGGARFTVSLPIYAAQSRHSTAT